MHSHSCLKSEHQDITSEFLISLNLVVLSMWFVAIRYECKGFYMSNHNAKFDLSSPRFENAY